MEEAIKVADPDRWERYILRRHHEEAATERAEQGDAHSAPAPQAMTDGQATPQASEGDDDEAEYLFRDLEEEEPDGQDAEAVRSPSACATFASQRPE